jgi:small-conductance mechanosensitive channel
VPDVGSVNHETTFLINTEKKKIASLGDYPIENKSCGQKLLHQTQGWMIFSLVLNAILFAGYMIFYFVKHDYTWGVLTAHTWLLFAIITYNSYILIRVATYFVKMLLEALLFTSIFFFYISGLGWPVATLIWDFFWWFLLQPAILKPVNEVTYYHLEQAFWIFFAIAVVFIIKSTLAQFVIGRFNKANFWKKVRKAVFKERVLQVLLHGQSRVQNTVNYAEIKERYSGIIPTFSLADLQQNIAINAKLRSLRKSSSGLGFLPSKKKSVSAFEREIGQTTDVIFRNLRNAAKKDNAKNSILLEPNQALQEHVTLENFKQYFNDQKTLAEAFQLFKVHDRRDDTLTRNDIESAVRILLRDRKILAKTLQNRQSISGIIVTTMGTLAWIAIAIISLWILDVNYIASLVPLGTALLALSFVFGNSVKNAFEAFLFLFFVKAYDVGDRIGIDSETVIISKINLLSTYAYTTDGRKMVIPTRRLSEVTVINYQRSRNHVVNLALVVSAQVPTAALDDLRRSIQKFIADRRDVYCPDLFFAFKTLDEQTKLQIDVSVELNGITWSSSGKYLNARSDLVKAIKDASEQFKIVAPISQVQAALSNRSGSVVLKERQAKNNNLVEYINDQPHVEIIADSTDGKP